MMIPVSIFIAMLLALAVMAVYRKTIARHEDDCLHMQAGTSQIVAEQANTAKALGAIDRIGIPLTIVTAVYGVLLIAYWLYYGLANYAGE
jgi:hypothetical protein